MTTQTPEPNPFRQFTAVLGAVDDGALVVDLNKQLAELVGDMENAAGTGKNAKAVGSITVTIALRKDGPVYDVSGAFAVKSPKQPRSKAQFWVNEDNTLTRRDPRQMDMQFRDVNAETGAPRTAV